jgi:hypothetical protein
MLITESKFKADTKSSDPIDFVFKNLSDRLEFKDGNISTSKNMVFISYKHGEKDYVYRCKDLLKQHGFEGYIDYEDDTMPIQTSGETAEKLKDAIKKSKKFILIASNGAINSKWCNWELGVADPHKYIHHLALLSIKPDYSNYEGEEYLQIYPTIQVNEQLNYYVNYPDGKKEPLGDWLKK